MCEDDVQQEVLVLDSLYAEDQLFSVGDADGRVSGGSFRARVRLPEGGAQLVTDGQRHRIQHVPPLQLDFELPPEYPGAGCPSFSLSASWLPVAKLLAIGNRLAEIRGEHSDEPVLWFWFEFLEKEAWEFCGLGSELRLDELLDAGDAVRRSATGSGGAAFSVLQRSGSPKLAGQCVLAEDAQERLAEFARRSHECPVCLAARSGADCLRFEPCGHVFCRRCVADSFRALIGQGCVRQLSCLQCSDASVTPAHVRLVLTDHEFQRYEQLLLQQTLSSMEDVLLCPRCEACVVIEDKDKEQLGLCPSCYFAFCVLCRATYHGNEMCQRDCESVRRLMEAYRAADGAQRYRLEQKFGKRRLQALEQEMLSKEFLDDLPRCPSCKAYVEKRDGCNKMTCFKCRTYFCWLCMQVLDAQNPYGHFSAGGPCRNRLFQGALGNEADAEAEAEELLLGADF